MKRTVWIISATVLVTAICTTAWWIQHRHRLPEDILSGNARLELGHVEVATLYAGRIQSVSVREGDMVQAGQELARLEGGQIAAQLDIARAARNRAQAAITAQQQKLDVAKIDWRNARDMHRDALVSDSELKKRDAQMKGERAGMEAAQAALAEADAQIRRAQDVDQDMVLRAPIDGLTEYRLAEPGEVVGAGSRVVSLLNISDVSMSLFLPVAQVARLKVGSDARIRLDGLDAIFPAKITFIASQAQFTPKYVETHSEREKLMFRIKLTVPPDVARKYSGFLKGGLTGTAYVKTNAADFPAELSVRLPQE